MGRLTADPELRQTPSGVSVCRFTVAVNRQYVDKQTGERQADFINITAWRNTADFVARYFHKASMIIVEGSLRNDNYTDQNGVKHYSMNVQADNVTFGESKSASVSGGNGGYAGNAGGQPYYDNSRSYQQQAPVQPQYDNRGYQQAMAQPQQPSVNESLQIGDLSDFEVLSDENVPF
jgi:single-strand DNA-binding protein